MAAIKDNKGNVVKAYEPYYSSIPDYEDEAELVERGVSPLMHYDPLGRLIRTDFPNGTFSKVEFTGWAQTSWDQNDTVAESDWYDERWDYGGADEALLKEKRAALEAYEHRETPTIVHLDTLGRPFLTVAHNKDGEDDVFTTTKSAMDIQGHVLEVVDARDNIAESRTYGMLGQSLKVESHDAGDRVLLLDALGQPMRTWDDRDQRFSITYDPLRRPVDRTVSVSGGSEKLLSRSVYGELLASPADTNHRGRVYRAYDGAGVATSLALDFKGQALEEQRQLFGDKTTPPDWSALLGEDTIAAMASAAASLLDAETFSASSDRDALGRVLTAISPDGSEVHYVYDEGGALQQVTLNHRGSETEQTVVGDITYDAKGRREEVVYGPTGSPTSTTTYTYDEVSQRLIRLRTVRESDSEAIQSLHYHYDPVGNITDIRDTAQQTVYFDKTVVAAANSYTYDALYRLVEATGREHSSEGTAQRTHADMTGTAQPMTSDPSAMRLYTQQFVYDEVGNILEMKHLPSSGTGWTRYCEYDAASNRLLATSAPGDDPEGPYTHEYDYDDHGNMVAMPHLSSMIWNHDDELQEVTAGSETVYFQYAGGNRSRKYVEKTGTTTEERIYLGNFEIYRKRTSGDIDIERESLHISDGTGRILLIETKTIDEGEAVTTPVAIWRYQLSNHIGSASTEITDEGDIISYEEYHPYGTTAYRAVDSSVDVSAKRYRYTGMERDEETGLSYHTARYYASWLGRWTAADPIGLKGGGNRFRYDENNPILFQDQNGNVPTVAQARAAVDEARHALGQAQSPETAHAAAQKLQQAQVILQQAGRAEWRTRQAVNSAAEAAKDFVGGALGSAASKMGGLDDYTLTEALVESRDFFVDTTLELRDRAEAATYEALVAGEDIYNHQEEAGLAIGELANIAVAKVSTKEGRREVGNAVVKGISTTLADGAAGVGGYSDAFMVGDVEAGANKLTDVGAGFLMGTTLVSVGVGLAKGVGTIARGTQNIRAAGRGTRTTGTSASVAAKGGVRYKLGKSVAPTAKTLEMALEPSLYIQTIVKKYGINLRGSGQKITVEYNPNLKSAGRSRKATPTVIEVGPSSLSSEAELANTLAHELNHARSWLRGGTAPESTAYPAGDALSEFIRGLR